MTEATLILILFSDAARINLNDVRGDHGLPVRMLLLGLPLVMIAGTVVVVQMFPGFTLWEAALLAALLATTCAAPGQSVVGEKKVPVRIRQAFNVESGLNDGIALPAVLLFAALDSVRSDTSGIGDWTAFYAHAATRISRMCVNRFDEYTAICHQRGISI